MASQPVHGGHPLLAAPLHPSVAAEGLPSKARASLELFRVWNGAVAALGALLGASLAAGGIEVTLPVALAALGALLVNGGGNGLNDYFDLAVDRVNRPDRPIPSGRLTQRGALRLSLGASAAGVALAFAAAPAAGAVAAMNGGLLALYARHSKRMLVTGNLLVSALVASVFPYGALVTTGNIASVLPITLCAFLSGLSLEVVKDIEDVRGDAANGARTLPLYAGTGASRIIAVGSMAAAVALSPGPFLAGGLSPLYWAFVGPADALFIAAVLVRPSLGRKAISLGMGLVLAGLAAGLLF
ncbi:MAG: geranylgeranylglycerol-phosphate geranylgeranyltransferase [Halobacteria archaeon]